MRCRGCFGVWQNRLARGAPSNESLACIRRSSRFCICLAYLQLVMRCKGNGYKTDRKIQLCPFPCKKEINQSSFDLLPTLILVSLLFVTKTMLISFMFLFSLLFFFIYTYKSTFSLANLYTNIRFLFCVMLITTSFFYSLAWTINCYLFQLQCYAQK